MNILLLFTNLSILICALLGVFTWRKLPLFAKLIILQVIIATVTEAGGIYLKRHTHNNVWLYNIYMLAEFVLIIAAGYMIDPSRRKRVFVRVSVTLYLAIWLLSMCSTQQKSVLNWPFITGCLLISLMYLWQLMNMLRNGQRENGILFMCYGILIYFSCIIPLFGFMNFILRMEERVVYNVYTINSGLNIIRYNLISAACLLFYKREKTAGNE